MADEIDDMCQKLSLHDDGDDEEVQIAQDWVEEATNAGKNCLVWRFLIHINFNTDTMKTVLFKAWRLKHELEISAIGGNRFVFQFSDEVEKDRVLVRQPWSYNKSLLVLQEFDGS